MRGSKFPSYLKVDSKDKIQHTWQGLFQILWVVELLAHFPMLAKNLRESEDELHTPGGFPGMTRGCKVDDCFSRVLLSSFSVAKPSQMLNLALPRPFEVFHPTGCKGSRDSGWSAGGRAINPISPNK